MYGFVKAMFLAGMAVMQFSWHERLHTLLEHTSDLHQL